MTVPLEITYRDIRPSPALAEAIQRQVAALERYYGRILRCEVAIEAPHRHRRHGAPMRVRVELVVPGRELVAGRSPDVRHDHEDVYFAMREAFRACRRQLQEFARVRRGEVKRHGAQLEPHAVPARG